MYVITYNITLKVLLLLYSNTITILESVNSFNIDNIWLLINKKSYEKKRKFKQWWSTIAPISTKWTITSHFNSLNIKEHHILSLKWMTTLIWTTIAGPMNACS
jgi:hypothetical protein